MPPAYANLLRQNVEQAHVHEHRRAYRTMDAILGATRVALGGIFLWAFLDKLLGLGFSTPAARAWVSGGSPTKGYLSSSVGPMAGFFQEIAGHPVTDLLFMAGLAGVGVALLLGVGVRIAGFAGAAMMLLMYASHPIWATSPATHPFLDDHLVYALVLVAMAVGGMGRHVGLGGWWAQQPLVQRHRWLE